MKTSNRTILILSFQLGLKDIIGDTLLISCAKCVSSCIILNENQ